MLTAFYKTCQYFLQSGDTTTPFGMMDKDPNLRNIAAHVAYSLSKGSGWKKKFITLMS